MSAVKEFEVSEATVRQTPFTAMLSPIFVPSKTRFDAMFSCAETPFVFIFFMEKIYVC